MSKTQKPWEHAKSGGSEHNALAARFVESISYDTRMYKHDIAGSVAHAQMLAHVGLINPEELEAIERGLAEIEQEIEAADIVNWDGWDIDLEDVHMCVEAALIEKIGEPGRKLHTGRSRNDQVAMDLRLWIRDAVHELDVIFDKVYTAFVGLAERDGDVVMPSYTHLQRAQPIVAGGEIIAWLTALDRAQRRFHAMLHVNEGNPLGGGAVAGSSLPLDRDHTSQSLGIGAPTPSSIDGTASRDAAIDFVYALSMTSMTLSRWAEQWIIYMTSEFGFLQIGDAYTTGSSMMPQKRNPDMLELVRGRCGNVYGNLTALLTICKGLTVGYNRDLQEDKRHVFAAFDMVKDCLLMTEGIASSAAFQGERIARDINKGFADATSLAEYLVTKGIPFRTGHQVVGQIVRRAEELGHDTLQALPLDEMQKISSVIEEDVNEWLGAENVVKRYTVQGNAGLSGYKTALATWKERLK